MASHAAQMVVILTKGKVHKERMNMISSKEQWNVKFKLLKKIITKPEENLPEIKTLIIELHDFTHETEENQKDTLGNQFWNIPGNFTRFNESKLYSPAWHIWHSTRIEDISCSHFILQEKESLYLFGFDTKLNVPFLHTGNSMKFLDMEIFNKKIDLNELRKYKKVVSIRTKDAINEMTIEKLNSKVQKQFLKEISEMGSVIKSDDWLLEYWGKKKISGIITMPLTRHLLVHLNSAIRNLK